MADFGKWFSNPLTQGLQNQADTASRTARYAQEEASKAQQQAEAAKQRASSASLDAHNLSSQVVDLECTIIDKDLEISKLNDKLRDTEAELQKKFALLKDFVLSQTAWKAIAKQVAAENGIPEDQLQHRVDIHAIDHAKSNPDHGFEPTSTFLKAAERMKSRQQNLI